MEFTSQQQQQPTKETQKMMAGTSRERVREREKGKLIKRILSSINLEVGVYVCAMGWVDSHDRN